MPDNSNLIGAAIARLEKTIKDRRNADPGDSYVASLLQAGRTRCAQKFGEEAVETVIAATAGDRRALTEEAADALFHLLVLLSANGVSTDEIAAELERRAGVSGHAERRSRK